MAHGTLSGMIAGAVVSGLVVGTASILTEVPGTEAPTATAVEVPAGSEFDQSREDTQAALPEAQETPDAGDVAKVAAPEPDDLSTIDTDATMSAAQPETGTEDVAMATPDAGDSAGSVVVETDQPVLPSPQADAPEAPVNEDELSISTEPAQPAQPEMSGEDSAFPEQEETGPEGIGPEETGAEEAPAEEAPETAEAEPASEEATATGDTAAEEPADTTEQTNTADAATTDVEAAEEEPAQTQPAEEGAESASTEPEEETASVDAQDQVIEPAMPEVEEPDALPVETPAQPEEEVAALADPETSSGTIDDIAKSVTTDRLPSVGEEPEPAAEEPVVEGEAEETDPVPAEDLPPLERFAAEFENPEAKPMMSIVLIDDGSSPIGLDALKSFPYPLSFAVDTGWSGAGEAMQKYRDAGFEVLAMINLPRNATASDTEVSVQTYLARVPEAVAIMEGEGDGLQSSRDASEQLADILRDSGHGAVLFSSGLNTAQKLIAREGVPSASVFRDFDDKGQSATVIRRFLDQAAFRAGQEEKGVIMVGRLRADTISALLLWGLQDRASRVAIAPVSAVLRAE